MNKFEKAEKIFDKIDEATKRGEPYIFFIDYEMKNGMFIPFPERETNIGWQIGDRGNKNLFVDSDSDSTREHTFETHPISYTDYKEKFDKIEASLIRGDTFLANLTIKTPITTDYTLKEIFARSNSRYGLYVPGKFVCFSPEIFIRISDNTIHSYPMKGTISGYIPDAENIILSDYKESCEHNTIVDFIRSDLARVATDVKVKRFRYIDRLKTSKGDILQVSSEITASMPENWESNFGKTIKELLPAGSICGAPRRPTVKAIREAENEERGYYTGIMGYFDGKTFDSAVMIRFIEQDEEGNKYFRSGGGITINSSSKEEYEEVIEKVYLPF